jgi:geranylgeranyl pyrophosphate synthase
MEAGAVPGIAIPLLRDGCANTSVDIDWVWDAIYTSKDDHSRRLNLDQLRTRVDGWFSPESLKTLLASGNSQTEELALEWMARAGKRWRPFLAVSTYEALTEQQSRVSESDLQKAALAVECFHKASLIHDDIEDDDTERYGRKTLHIEYGIPIALNVGDFLLGEGYRLLAELEVDAELKARVVEAAVHGHRDLCLGQGNELTWAHNPGPLSVSEVVDIFRKKTAPAFDVALKIGSILAGRIDELSEPLEQYSEALGIAYQIRDDIEDFYVESAFTVPAVTRPSFLLAIANEMAQESQKQLLESIWDRSVEMPAVAKELESAFTELQIERAAFNVLESYKSQAIAALALLKNASLKGLLRRVAAKIFNDFEMMGCCNDHTQGHAQDGGRSGATAG